MYICIYIYIFSNSVSLKGSSGLQKMYPYDLVPDLGRLPTVADTPSYRCKNVVRIIGASENFVEVKHNMSHLYKSTVGTMIYCLPMPPGCLDSDILL